MADRQGWPQWAKTRVECASCGEYGYSEKEAPPIGATAPYEKWLISVWPMARAQHTRLGFYVWHNLQCEVVWKKTRGKDFIRQSGWAHAHGIEMDKRRLKAGVL